MSTDPSTLRPATLLARAGGAADPATGAVVPALVASSTFDRRARSGFEYLRDDNPTGRHVERLVAALEGGVDALLLASGMAAATSVFDTLAPGAEVLAPVVMYWNLRRWLQDRNAEGRLRVRFVEMSDTAAVAAAIAARPPALVWIETPANPLWTVTDIAAVAKLAHDAGALVAVDSTAATPLATRPLALGADLVIHSASKYLNGHSDLVAGVVVAARDDDLFARIRGNRHDRGAVPGPFEAWLLLRGLRTLELRFERACASALAIARHFAADPRVHAVLYPGLPGHPGHEVAARQMGGRFGGMLSIRVRGGGAAAAAVAASTRIWVQATSLGGVESLIEHRAPVEGPESPVPPDLLRLSVGIEDPADLIADLDAALSAAGSARG